MTENAASPPVPPRAERRPVAKSAHGVRWTDEYAWLRAENWQEALSDPAALAPEIRALLEAENAYADAVLAPTKPLQTTLVAEMRARLVEDDSEPPQADGPWAYFTRYRSGGQHRLVCRRPRDGGGETILLDGDACAAGKAFFSLEAASHSPDHAKLAWAADDLGSELMTIRVRDLVTGEDLDDRVVHAGDDIVWTRELDRLSLRRAGRQSSPVPGEVASARRPAGRRRRDIRRVRPRLVHRRLRVAKRAHGHDRRSRP